MAGAAGAASTDIGAFEPGNAPAGSSLSLVGIGDRAADFTWAYLPGGATPGQLNAGQALPEPGSILLTLIAAGLTFVVRRRAH